LWLTHGAETAFQALRTTGWGIGLLTNGDPSTQAAKVRVLGLEALVDHVVYANEHAPGGKPAHEPFLEILRRLQLPPCEAVMVGDDPVNDIDGARALGIRTIFLARAGRPHAPAADAVVHVLGDVPRVAAALVGQELRHAA
jgi:putative hydrolase of the HAD superfamily